MFAGLRERAGTHELELELSEGADIRALKRALEQQHPNLGSLAHVRVAINRDYADDGRRLSEQDEIALIPPVSGGSGEDALLERGVFELAEHAIDTAACQRRVEHRSCGGVVLFSGLARDNNRERQVERLEYEAYAAMLAPEMGRVFARARERFGDSDGTRPQLRLRMLVVHRSGRVEIGEPAVVVAVASPHRDAAFLACRFLIDELKATLPVWKSETYTDGEAWIGDRP
jgi:molybdopterin synthase catalytic subunit